ncbi:HD-GYP domain-containing protein [Arhodomonas aquaeolei]|uniref:HD-GYP domain-containing protein n=1 Tax=Arhodomonas aquaeolei TaxID=2369 RepID=UPI0003745C8A|nr:HD-GYP domain-containing protein [Arhodomonas aquaeolei]
MALRSLLQAFGGEAPGGSDTESHLVSLMIMAQMVEARDPYTGGHLWRVSRYARLLAEALGATPAQTARVSLGGFLHDLGKISVPDAVLRKPGALTDEEFAVIRTHPTVGVRLLQGHPLAAMVEGAVGAHHERIDGGGYPRGFEGAEIPWEARVVGVCDAFDAMTSHRPYRAGMPPEQALEIIRRERGRQFDANCANAFCGLPAADIQHVAGHSDEGIPLQECPVCGPTLVRRREQGPGDHLYCPGCAGEFRLDSTAVAVPTGAKGGAADLAPRADVHVIGEIAAEAAPRL